MFISSLCGPAIVYIGFSLIQILIDIYKGIYNNAFIKFIVMIILSMVINILCDMGYTVIAWILVFIPIIMMTIISALLLKVFGLSPDANELRSKIKDGSNNSMNSLSGSNLLNQQKLSYFYDKYNSLERIDRDKIRNDLYDNIDKMYDLSGTAYDLSGDKYDLSNNFFKFRLVDSLINTFGDNYFFQSIRKLGFLNPTIPSNTYGRYSASYGGSSSIGPDYEIRADKMNGPDFDSYAKTYADDFLSDADGYLLYEKDKYDSVKETIESQNPNATRAEIQGKVDHEIQRQWDNLTGTQQKEWNTEAKTEEENATDGRSYNPNNFSQYHSQYIPLYQTNTAKLSNNQPCPSNETPGSFKTKTGLNCYEVCPPGHERNSLGICVGPCPTGQERKMKNSECE